MAGKDEYRIFVGGLSSDIMERDLESRFGRFGKILECQLDDRKIALFSKRLNIMVQILCGFAKNPEFDIVIIGCSMNVDLDVVIIGCSMNVDREKTV